MLARSCSWCELLTCDTRSVSLPTCSHPEDTAHAVLDKQAQAPPSHIGVIEKAHGGAWMVVTDEHGLTRRAGRPFPESGGSVRGRGYDRAEEQAKGVAQRCLPSPSVRFTVPTIL